MLERFIDPTKIRVEEDCVEVDEKYVGERVEGFKIRGVELAEIGEGDGVEIIGDLRNLMGIHVLVSEISEETVQAIESLFGEIINRMKGVEYKFRKGNVEITVSDLERFKPECVGKLIYDALKRIPTIRSVRVRIICDEKEFKKLAEKAEKIHREREKIRIRDLDVDIFYACTSCQVYLPNHVCVISPERPSPCGTTYIEAKAAYELKIVGYYQPVKKGMAIDELRGEYKGINEFVRNINGEVNRLKLHCVLDSPPLTGNYAEAIVFYIPEKDGFGVVDRNYKGKTPVGLTFSELEKIILGRQVKGFVGVSRAYMNSEGFLRGEGGWKRIVWVSPNLRNRYIITHSDSHDD